MVGPIRFIFSVLWFAIALSALGTLKACTQVLMGYAVEANQHQMSIKEWNKALLVERESNK